MVTLSLACDINIKDWDTLELSQIAEIILEKGKYNKEIYGDSNNKEDKKEEETVIRVATQDDWDRFGS